MVNKVSMDPGGRVGEGLRVAMEAERDTITRLRSLISESETNLYVFLSQNPANKTPQNVARWTAAIQALQDQESRSRDCLSSLRDEVARLQEVNRNCFNEKYPPSETLLTVWDGQDRAGTPAVIDAPFLQRQADWATETFGPGPRTAAVVAHIRKELIEVEADSGDVVEWADVILIAFNGAMRAGHPSQTVIDAVHDKQSIVEERDWPDWRTATPGEPIEHIRAADPRERQTPRQ